MRCKTPIHRPIHRPIPPSHRSSDLDQGILATWLAIHTVSVFFISLLFCPKKIVAFDIEFCIFSQKLHENPDLIHP